MKKILLYNAETETKTDSMRRLMALALKNTGIVLEEVTAATLTEKLTADVKVLILPGARAGNAYREQLRGSLFDLIRDRTAQGMQVMGICAGAFVLSNEFEYKDYDPANGNLREIKQVKSELGMAALKSFGPDLRLYKLQPREESNPWSVYTTAKVSFQAGAHKINISLALSKGPSMTALDPARCTPLGIYEDTGDVAIAAFKYGLGGGIISGPALEVGGPHLVHYVHPKHHNNAAAASTIQALESSSGDWAKLWVKIFENLLPGEPQLIGKIARNFGVEQATLKRGTKSSLKF